MRTKPLIVLNMLLLMLIVSGCETSTSAPPPTVKYIPCVSLPGPFPYVEEGIVWAESTLLWGDEYNAVWEALCEE